MATATMTVKIPAEAHARLAEFAAADGRPMGDVLDRLIDQEWRRRFFDEFDAAFARLKADPEAWADWQAELRSMEGTLMDGLEDDPWYEAEGSSPEGTSGKWSSTPSGAASRPVAVRP